MRTISESALFLPSKLIFFTNFCGTVLEMRYYIRVRVSNRARTVYFDFTFEQQFPYLNKGYRRANGDHLQLLLYKSIARTALLTYLEMLLIIDLRNNRTIILNRMLKLIIATHFQHYYSSLNYY